MELNGDLKDLPLYNGKLIGTKEVALHTSGKRMDCFAHRAVKTSSVDQENYNWVPV